MEEKIKFIYKLGFIKYLEENIDLKRYCEIINNSGLYFGVSTMFKSNIKSDYYNLLNDFYIDNLSDDNKNKLASKDTVDDEVLLIVKETYKEVLKKGNSNYIMYNPPLPEHSVINGSIVLEFVYGKNSQKLSNDEYIELVKKQRKFIKEINNSLIKELSEKFNIPVNIFVEKRI